MDNKLNKELLKIAAACIVKEAISLDDRIRSGFATMSRAGDNPNGNAWQALRGMFGNTGSRYLGPFGALFQGTGNFWTGFGVGDRRAGELLNSNIAARSAAQSQEQLASQQAAMQANVDRMMLQYQQRMLTDMQNEGRGSDWSNMWNSNPTATRALMNNPLLSQFTGNFRMPNQGGVSNFAPPSAAPSYQNNTMFSTPIIGNTRNTTPNPATTYTPRANR
jgi:hypothetical protein